jgi:hypothetical protein
MREKTLKHLLLVFGKYLLELEIDQETKQEVMQVCESLRVTREKRSPYLVSWEEHGIEKSILIDETRLIFHVRGDVTNRNSPQLDVREKNWFTAAEIWSEILGKAVQATSEKMSPFAFGSRQRIKPSTYSHAILVFALTIQTLWLHTSTGIGISAIMILAMAIRCYSSVELRNLSVLIFILVICMIFVLKPVMIFPILFLLLIETVAMSLTSKWLLGSILCFSSMTSFLYLLIFAGPALSLTVLNVLSFAVLGLISLTLFPRGDSGDLLRVSVPLSVGALFLVEQFSSVALLVSGLFYLLVVAVFHRFVMGRKTSSNQVTGTPVTVRQSRGL